MRVIIMALLLGMISAVQAVAQAPVDLDRLDDKLIRHVESEMPGWKHKRGEPIPGSKNVLIEFWSFSNRVVKISIVPYGSAQEAREVLQRFKKYNIQKEELTGLGDDAYGSGYGFSNVTFTKGKFIMYVSTYAEVDSDPDARMLSQVERGNRERAEMRRLSREFAKHLADAMDLL